MSVRIAAAVAALLLVGSLLAGSAVGASQSGGAAVAPAPDAPQPSFKIPGSPLCPGSVLHCVRPPAPPVVCDTPGLPGVSGPFILTGPAPEPSTGCSGLAPGV
jgi:hypothetical protein